MRGKGKVLDVRPQWDKYFLRLANLVAERSTCLRRKVGALLVRENRILATGYNGAPHNVRHCLEVGCLRESLGVEPGAFHELCRGLHAEQNAIIQAVREGVSTKGATLYCTTSPCSICTKLLINAGIERIVVASDYPDSLGREMMNEVGLKVECVSFTGEG
jgi:dCMP deaminase